jgi:hypothetical protein
MRFRAYLNRIRTVLDARQEISIERFQIDEIVPGRAGVIEGRLRFWDDSLLEFVEALEERDFVLVKMDYSYHYQDGRGELYFRYDNAPHHPEISTYPHHKHTRDDVEPATPPDFGDILQEIDKILCSHLDEE